MGAGPSRPTGHEWMFGGTPDRYVGGWVRPRKNPSKPKRAATAPAGNNVRSRFPEGKRNRLPPQHHQPNGFPPQGMHPRGMPPRAFTARQPSRQYSNDARSQRSGGIPTQFDMPEGKMRQGAGSGSEEELGPGSRLPSGIGERQQSNRSQHEQKGSPPPGQPSRRTGREDPRAYAGADDRDYLSGPAPVSRRGTAGGGPGGKAKSRR